MHKSCFITSLFSMKSYQESYFLISDVVEQLWISFEDLSWEFSTYDLSIQETDKVSETTLSYILAGIHNGSYDWMKAIETHTHEVESDHTYIWSHQDIYEQAFDIQRWSHKIGLSEQALRQELYDHGIISDIYANQTIELNTIKKIIDTYDFDYNNDTILSSIDAETYTHYTSDQETTYDIVWLAGIIGVPTSSLVWRLVYNRNHKNATSHATSSVSTDTRSKTNNIYNTQQKNESLDRKDVSWYYTNRTWGIDMESKVVAAGMWIVGAWATLIAADDLSISDINIAEESTATACTKNTCTLKWSETVREDDTYSRYNTYQEANIAGIYDTVDTWAAVMTNTKTWLFSSTWVKRGLFGLLGLWLLWGLSMNSWKKATTPTAPVVQEKSIDHGTAKQETVKEINPKEGAEEEKQEIVQDEQQKEIIQDNNTKPIAATKKTAQEKIQADMKVGKTVDKDIEQNQKELNPVEESTPNKNSLDNTLDDDWRKMNWAAPATTIKPSVEPTHNSWATLPTTLPSTWAK